jgi:hypothetical protein
MRLDERIAFLWNQHSYVSDYIKFADAKAALIASGTTAIIGAAFGSRLKPGSVIALHAPRSVQGYLVVASFILLAASVVFSAWSIKPRLLTGKRLRPMSWVDIANYRDAEAFEAAHSKLGADELGAMLTQQIYFMSKICKRKHSFVAISLLLCTLGATLMLLQAVKF